MVGSSEVTAAEVRREAQSLYGRGEFALAASGYDQARDLYLAEEPPDLLGASIVARGAGSAYERIGSSLAQTRFDEAAAYFDEVESAVDAGAATEDEVYAVNRERAQRAITTGTLLVRRCLRLEDQDKIVPKTEGQFAGMFLNEANTHLSDVEGDSKKPDQYRINGMSRFVIWTAFYGGEKGMGDRDKAIAGAWRGIDFGLMSESPWWVLEAAGHGFMDRMRAKGRALARGSAALAAAWLVTPEQTTRRKLARRVARFAL